MKTLEKISNFVEVVICLVLAVTFITVALLSAFG